MPLPITTERLLIRSPSLDDVDAFHRIMTDERVTEFLPVDPNASIQASRDRAEARIQHEIVNGFTIWTVIERASGEIAGACGFFLVEGRGPEIELAYHFAADHWDKGYATEAAAACLRFGFRELELDRIIAMALPDNFASRRVLEKVGMTFERKAEYYGREMVVYAIDDPDAITAA
jgi:RimJ/RimL family protein N-acetyltransferase